MSAWQHSRVRGFTMIELVVALVVGAILFGLMGMMIAGPVDGFFAQSRRARLSDSASSLWHNIDRDVRAALPLNVRSAQAGNFVALEMLTVVSSGRYPQGVLPGPVSNFPSAGTFNPAPGPVMLAIIPTGIPPNGAYVPGNNFMTPSTTVVQVAGTPQQVTVNPAMTFAADSPRRRAYLVSEAVSYLCDTNAGTVTRFSGYDITAGQPVVPGAFATGQAALIATNVTACAFNFIPPVPPNDLDHGGVVTIRYTITTPDGESMTLQLESRVENPA